MGLVELYKTCLLREDSTMQFNYQENSLKPGIYKIINTHTNRIYVGQAKRFAERWRDHKRHLLSKTHQNKFLLNDFNKCKEELGHDNFLEFHVLEVMEGSTKEERNVREEFYIHSIWDTQENCYNFKKKTEAKERSCYSKTPETTSELISKNMKAVWQDKEKNSKRVETISSKEYREKQSSKMKEKWMDASYSEHQKDAIAKGSTKLSSERMKAKWALDPEYRDKMIEINKRLSSKRQEYWDNLPEARKQEIIEKRRAATQQALVKHHGFVKSPSGNLHEVINAKEFALKHNLNPGTFHMMLKGQRSSHKGWTLP